MCFSPGAPDIESQHGRIQGLVVVAALLSLSDVEECVSTNAAHVTPSITPSPQATCKIFPVYEVSWKTQTPYCFSLL